MPIQNELTLNTNPFYDAPYVDKTEPFVRYFGQIGAQKKKRNPHSTLTIKTIFCYLGGKVEMLTYVENVTNANSPYPHPPAPLVFDYHKRLLIELRNWLLVVIPIGACLTFSSSHCPNFPPTHLAFFPPLPQMDFHMTFSTEQVQQQQQKGGVARLKGGNLPREKR